MRQNRLIRRGPGLFFDRQEDLYRFEDRVSLSGGRIDPVNGIIHGVAVITSGVVARGHELHVDNVTLKQMEASAKAKQQVPVKWNHGSGADNIAGHLTNFRVRGNKLLGDLVLLQNHPSYNLIIEMAEKQPKTFGLSAAFAGKEETRMGIKYARCEDLVSVDVVAQPAANPDGFFSARVDTRRQVMQSQKEPTLVELNEGIQAINDRLDAYEQYEPEYEDYENEYDEDEYEDEDEGPVDLSGMSEQEILYHYENGDLTDEDLEANGLSFGGGEDEYEDEYDEYEDEYDGGEDYGGGDYGYGATGTDNATAELSAKLRRVEGAIHYLERKEREAAQREFAMANEEAMIELEGKIDALVEFNRQLQLENAILQELSAGYGEDAVAIQTDRGLHIMHGQRGGLTEFHATAADLIRDGMKPADAYRELMTQNPALFQQSLRDRGIN